MRGTSPGEPGLADHARRHGDFRASPTMVDMFQLLMSRPSCDRIAQHLVLRVMRAHEVRAAVISVFVPDGTLHEVGMFGLSRTEFEDVRCLALTDRTPMTDAARSGDPVVLATGGAVLARYPWMGSPWRECDPMAAWPLTLPDEYVGAVQFTFLAPPDVEALRADADGVAAVLALYLSLLRDAEPAMEQIAEPDAEALDAAPNVTRLRPYTRRNESETQPSFPADPPVAGSSDPAERRLTPRQLRILSLMAEGLSHAQISVRIGFSESTVRHESMTIYRMLGVTDRREAVRQARLHGLVATSNE